jgi:hypothetical protein
MILQVELGQPRAISACEEGTLFALTEMQAQSLTSPSRTMNLTQKDLLYLLITWVNCPLRLCVPPPVRGAYDQARLSVMAIGAGGTVLETASC